MNKTINEAIKDDVKSVLGQKIIDLFGLFGKNKSIEFTFSSGTKIVLKCIKAANINFEFEILLDDKNILCQWDKLLLTLKIGNKNDTNPIGKYTLNQTIIEPSDKTSDAFTLFFKAKNDKGEYGVVNFRNIVSVEQSTLSQYKRKCNEVPTEQKPEEKPDENKKDEDEKIDPKALYDSIINDPALRDAFYKQPTFWNYLKAIVKGEKPRGAGIISAAEIVSDYKRNKIFDELGGGFVEGKILNYKLIDPTQIIFEPSNPSDNQIVYNNLNTYKAKVLEIKYNYKNCNLYDEKNDVSIIILSKNKKSRIDNAFNAKFVKKYVNGEDKKFNGVIVISNIKDSGYYKEEEKQTTK